MNASTSTQPTPRRRCRACALHAVLLLAALSATFAAEGPIFSVQDALKRENVFLGERTGVLDEPTQSALRRFQLQRGLPATGQIDAATLQALQSSVAASQPTVQSLPPTTAVAKPNPETVVKDKAFLEKLEQSEAAREEEQPAVAAMPPPPTATPAPVIASTPEAEAPEPVAEESAPPKPAKARATEKNPPVAVETKRERERPQQSASVERNPKPAPERVATPPARRQNATTAKARTEKTRRAAVEEVAEPDPLEPGGVRIIRSTTVTPDGRTYISERRSTVTTSDEEPVIIRRAEPVRPRTPGLFDRIFNGDDDDDD